MLPLVLIPGLGSDAAVWAPTITELEADVASQIGDTLSDDSLPAMAARILQSAPRRFALAGVSMGGMVALEIMRIAPERVTKLALFDTNAEPSTAEQSARRKAVNAAMLATDDLASLAAPAIAYMVGPNAGENIRAALMQMTLRVGAAAYVRQNEAMIVRNDLRPMLSTVAVPTMIVVGADDLMTPLACSEAIHAAIPGSVLQVIPDCGHLPPIEQPRVVAALLRDWLG